MKYLICTALLLTYISARSQQDTVAIGNITSAITKEPVTAKISFKSLPYGNKIGILSGNTFNVPMVNKEKYSFLIEAVGYAAVEHTFDPLAANADGKVIKNIELELPVASTTIAQKQPTKMVARLRTLIFSVGTARIQPSSFSELDSVSQMLKTNPGMVIQLEGHTDVVGVPATNMKLSQDRVDAVKAYIVSKGAKKDNIKTKAFGGTQPLSTGNTETSHKLNRRVELRVLKN